jgi:excisionase family DNA binding protein
MGMTDIEKRALKGGAAFMEVIAAPIGDACRISGLSRSEVYRRLAAGDIRAIKSGSRALILMDSLRAYLASLPAATFRTQKGSF